jgi:hypothetical protein
MESKSDTAAQETTTERKSGLPLYVWISVVLPFIYVLSTGPVDRLAASGYFQNNTLQTAVDVAYRPLFWLSDECPPFEKFMNWYLHVWRVGLLQQVRVPK